MGVLLLLSPAGLCILAVSRDSRGGDGNMMPILLLLVLMAQDTGPPPVPENVVPAIAAATYENFTKVDPRARVPLFHRLTQWNRATLMREHLERWRRQNADRLSQEQLSAVAEYLAIIEQLASGTRAGRDRERALSERLEQLFTPDDLQQASVLTGACIP